MGTESPHPPPIHLCRTLLDFEFEIWEVTGFEGGTMLHVVTFLLFPFGPHLWSCAIAKVTHFETFSALTTLILVAVVMHAPHKRHSPMVTVSKCTLWLLRDFVVSVPWKSSKTVGWTLFWSIPWGFSLKNHHCKNKTPTKTDGGRQNRDNLLE